MKVLACVDIHGSGDAFAILKRKSQEAAIILCAGDISVFENHLSLLVRQMADLKKPVIMLNGNHEDAERLKNECKKYNNIIFLHKGIYEYKDFIFIGFGGGGFSEKNPEFRDFIKKIKPYLKKETILITHAPPYGTAVDYIHNSHVGNKDYAYFIKKFQPLLAVSGHIHETAGKESFIGKTKVINPGPFGRIIEL